MLYPNLFYALAWGLQQWDKNAKLRVKIMRYTEAMLKADALKGRTYIVTGGGSGLGKAMTRCFMQLGARVVITIDDGEWLKGAGQFNRLEEIPDSMWDSLEQAIKAKKKS